MQQLYALRIWLQLSTSDYTENVYGTTHKSSGWTLLGEMGFQLKH